MDRTKDLVFTRTYSKPVSKVFNAFTNPKNLKKWFAPDGLVVTLAEVHARKSGAYRIEMIEDGERVTIRGRYLEFKKNSRLVFTWVWDFDPDHELLVTIDFVRLDRAKSKVKIHQKGFVNKRSRNNHRIGWSGGLSNLKKFLK